MISDDHKKQEVILAIAVPPSVLLEGANLNAGREQNKSARQALCGACHI